MTSGTATHPNEAPDHAGGKAPERVVYLLGAGATHGCVRYRNSAHNLIMDGLRPDLKAGMRKLAEKAKDPTLVRFINDVADDTTDFEHLITFLDDAPSEQHRELARKLKTIFADVLRKKLDAAKKDLKADRSFLYAALVDMHQTPDTNEELQGFLTLNYDVFLDHAIESTLKRQVDHGLHIPGRSLAPDAIPVLKLHGSFGWQNRWPVELAAGENGTLWIPPGIRKAKADYPFNLLWGLARELLDCDVVRIIGCNLNPNDWDLVSLLFTTKHAHAQREPYRIEVISRPRTTEKVQKLFPYLKVDGILDLTHIGPAIVGELLGGPPTALDDLDEQQRKTVIRAANEGDALENSFARWLLERGEWLNREGLSLESKRGIFKRFFDEATGGGDDT